MGNLCDFELLHGSFLPLPAGFLTKSLLRGAAGWAGSSYENITHKVRGSRTGSSDAVSDWKARAGKEIVQRGPGMGSATLGVPLLHHTVNVEYKAQVFIAKKKKKKVVAAEGCEAARGEE